MAILKMLTRDYADFFRLLFLDIAGLRYSGKKKIDYRLLTEKLSRFSYNIPAIGKTLL